MDYNDDDIREPDPIIKERLIDNHILYSNSNSNSNNNSDDEFNPESIYEKEFLDILELSRQEFEQIEIPKKKQIDEKMEIIQKLKTRINKLINFDKENSYYYELILTILEMYSNNYIQVYESNEIEKYEVFKLMRQTRISKEELDLLENIII
jgi:hypothetical protein